MNSLTVVVFTVALAFANAGFLGFGHGHEHSTVLQGPSSKTTLVGNDGHHIFAHAPGGQVHTSVDVGYAAHSGLVAAPIVAHHGVVAHSAPVVSHHGLVAHSAPAIVAHHGLVAHSAPVFAHQGSSSVVSTSLHQTHPSPAVVAHVAPVAAYHAAPAVVAHHGLVAHSAPVLAHHGVVAHGVPTVLSHHGLAHSAYPIHAAGSGIEGQYVHDYTEKLYDDGSYKGEAIYHH